MDFYEDQDRPAAGGDRDLRGDKLSAPLAALCYIPPLWVLPFLLKADNGFVRFHARQAVVLFFVGLFFALHRFVPLIWPGLAHFMLTLLILISFYGAGCALFGRVCRIFIISDIAERVVM